MTLMSYHCRSLTANIFLYTINCFKSKYVTVILHHLLLFLLKKSCIISGTLLILTYFHIGMYIWHKRMKYYGVFIAFI